MRAFLAGAALLLLVGCQTELDQGLSVSEANDIVALLLSNDIPASRQAMAKDGTMTVFVERGRFADAVHLLKAHGLPRQRFANTSTVFTGGGLVSSPVEERARMVFALEQELSETLSQIDGVLTARVHVVLPESSGLKQDPVSSSAAVFLKHDSNTKLDTLIPQVKTLVANSVAGLTYNTVSVVLVPSARINAAAAPRGPALISVLGIWVDRGSELALEAAIGAVCLLLLMVAGVAAWKGRAALSRRRQRQTGTAILVR